MTEQHDEDLTKLESCMSMEYKEGWIAISILIDSGASDSVCPPGLFPEVPVYETSASRNGLEYTAAGGHKIPNLGMCQPIIHTLEGDQKMFAFQVAGVSKALGAVSRLTGSNNDVVFRNPNRGGSFIYNVENDKKYALRQTGGVYWFDVWVKPGNFVDNKGQVQDFHRQVS